MYVCDFVTLREGGVVNAALKQHREQGYAIDLKPTLGMQIRRNGMGYVCNFCFKLVN